MYQKSRLLAFCLVTSFALVFSACPGPEWPKCENDDHCKNDREGNSSGKDLMCVFGQCQECAKDENCKDGKICRANRCVPKPECESDGQCSDNRVCRAGKCQVECSISPDCGPGRACENKRCVTKTECAEDSDCTGGQSCVDGSCQQADNATGACNIEPRIEFDFNEASLTTSARSILDANAKCLKERAELKLTIEGHCDERGTAEFNLSLGERRANSAKKYLQQLGVELKRIKVISYGEEQPLDPGSSESSWARNRRAEFKTN